MKIKLMISAGGEIISARRCLWQPGKQFTSLIMEIINRESDKSMLSAQVPADYPWSFVLPDRSRKGDRCFLGAVVAYQGKEKRFFASCVSLKIKQAEQLLLHHMNFTFWQARILAMLVNNDNQSVDEEQWSNWLLSLERALLPGWKYAFFRRDNGFSRRKTLLLSACCKTDFALSADAGVERMPWTAWPFCLRHSHVAWLWRQSRQARIIDSQKITLQ